MKISHVKITASSNIPVQIPVPFNNYYDIVSEKELDRYAGYVSKPGEPTPCEAAEGYNIKHLAWVLAKPDVRDWLADADIDIAELVTSDWEPGKPQLAYTVGKKIFPIEMKDIADAINGEDRYIDDLEEDIESSTKTKGTSIKASGMPKIPAPFDEYYQIMSDEEVEELTGYPAHPSPCEDCEGYDIKNICYLAPKKIYEDELFADGIGDVELLREGNRVFVGYCSHDRVYSVDKSDLPEMKEDVESSVKADVTCNDEVDELEDAFGDDPVGGIATMLGIAYDDAEDIFDAYDAKGVTADYDMVRDFLNFVNDDVRNSLEGRPSIIGPLNDSLSESISRGIEGCDQVSVNSTVNTGLQYWYYSRHGFGPGTIPQGVQVEDWYEEGYKTWMKLDKMLTTQELNDFDLKEQTPPVGVTTHNGDVIEACDNINASECTLVKETDDSLDYVVSNTETDVEASEDFVIDTDLSYLDEPGYFEKVEKERIAREVADEDDAYDREHGEGQYKDVNGGTAIALNNIDLDGLKEDLNEAVLDYMSGQGFLRPGEPQESRWDLYATDYYRLEVARDKLYDDDCIKCEVRAELEYESMENLIDDYLDPVIKNYDSDAYFEMEDPGIAVAYLFGGSRIEDSTSIKAADEEISADEIVDEDAREDVDAMLDVITIEIPVDTEVTVNPDTTWKLEDTSFINDYVSDQIDKDKLAEDFEYVFAWAVPADEGKYNIKADVTLTYVANGGLDGGYVYLLNPKESKAIANDIQPAGKLDEGEPEEVVVEESTNIDSGSDASSEDVAEVKAASGPMMTEEELDNAILEGRPFDLASFKKYKIPQLGDDILTADKIEVGDVVAVTENAEEVNLGTVVKILSVNDPDKVVDWADYTFHVQLLESPEKYWSRGLDPYRNTTMGPGDEMDLHFFADDYVGPLVAE